MKTQTQFKNASLVSVVNGSIVVKDSTGREHTFTNASVVSVNNGTIIIESEWKPKRGELVKITGCNYDSYSLFDRSINGSILTFGFINLDGTAHRLSEGVWPNAGTVVISPVTPEEQKEFDDFCKSQGKIWNKEKLQWKEYKWEPERNEKYYFVDCVGRVMWSLYNSYAIDRPRIKYGNCFQTEQRAKEVAEKVKELFKSL